MFDARRRDLLPTTRVNAQSNSARASMTSPLGRVLLRHGSDLTLSNSTPNDLVPPSHAQTVDYDTAHVPQYHMTTSQRRRDVTASRSISQRDIRSAELLVSTLPEPTTSAVSSPVKRGGRGELVRHESPSSFDNDKTVVSLKSRGMVRYNSQPSVVIMSSVGGSAASTPPSGQGKSRNDTVTSRRDNLGRHGSLPTVVLAGNENVAYTKRHDSVTSPTSQERVTPRQRNDNLMSPKRHENITFPQRQDKAMSSQNNNNVTSPQRHDLPASHNIVINADLTTRTKLTPHKDVVTSSRRYKSPQAGHDVIESSLNHHPVTTSGREKVTPPSSPSRSSNSERQKSPPVVNTSTGSYDITQRDCNDVATPKSCDPVTSRPTTHERGEMTQSASTSSPRRTSSASSGSQISGRQLLNPAAQLVLDIDGPGHHDYSGKPADKVMMTAPETSNTSDQQPRQRRRRAPSPKPPSPTSSDSQDHTGSQEAERRDNAMTTPVLDSRMFPPGRCKIATASPRIVSKPSSPSSPMLLSGSQERTKGVSQRQDNAMSPQRQYVVTSQQVDENNIVTYPKHQGKSQQCHENFMSPLRQNNVMPSTHVFSSLAARNEAAKSDSSQSDLSPKQNPNHQKTQAASPASQSSSSSNQDEVRKKAAPLLPPKPLPRKLNQTGADTDTIPSPKEKDGQVSSRSSSQSYRSSSSSNQDNVRKKTAAHAPKPRPRKLNRTGSSNTSYSVASLPKTNASQTVSGSPHQSFPSSLLGSLYLEGEIPPASSSKSQHILPSPRKRQSQLLSSDFIEAEPASEPATIAQTLPLSLRSSSKSHPRSDRTMSPKQRDNFMSPHGHSSVMSPLMSKSAPPAGRSSSVERNYSTVHSNSVTLPPPQKPARQRSKSASRAVFGNYSRLVITNIGDNETLAKPAADFGYTLSTYRDGEVPVYTLDNQPKRRSRRETAISAAKATDSQLPSFQDDAREARDEPEDRPESRSRLETANVVVVRPLPTFGHVVQGVDNADDDVSKNRFRRETSRQTPVLVMTGSDDEEDMRSRRSSVFGVSMASRKKSALRKTTRSHSSDRHVSYSNTDIVYRYVCLSHFRSLFS